MFKSTKSILQAIVTALARAVRSSASFLSRLAHRNVNQSLLDELAQVAEHIHLLCFSSNSTTGIQVIRWRPLDEITFEERAPLHTMLFHDCLVPVHKAGLTIYAICWFGQERRPEIVNIRDQEYQITEDGTLLRDGLARGCLVPLGCSCQAFAILKEKGRSGWFGRLRRTGDDTA